MASQTVLAQTSAAVTSSGSTGRLNVENGVSTLAVNVNVAAVAGTSPTLNVYLEGLDAVGNWYLLWQPAQITVAGSVPTSVGPGCATNVVVPPSVRFRWVLGGTSPSFTFSVSIVGRDQP
jgi:hypothetical protein